MNQINHFNIRVYGIFTDPLTESILLSDEYVLDSYMTKFPGGGLHFGEGPEDCIKRECLEEFGQEIEIIEHFYTTGFFQKALYYNNHQLISIYYRTKFINPPGFKISERKFDFPEPVNESQSFRWTKISKLNQEDLTFPIDQFVSRMIIEKWKTGPWRP